MTPAMVLSRFGSLKVANESGDCSPSEGQWMIMSASIAFASTRSLNLLCRKDWRSFARHVLVRASSGGVSRVA